MIAKHLKRLLGSVAITALTVALAHPVIAQTSGSGAPLYKTGTSVNVGQPSDTQLSRDELNENTYHDRIEEGLDGEDRSEDITHQLRLKQLEAAQTPYKPEYIADENEHHDNVKKEIAQKKAIEDARHSKALAAIMAAAKSLIGGAAGALGNAANGGGGGAPSGSSPPPNSGGGSASNPNSGSGSPGNRAYPGGAPGGVPNNPALGGNGSPSNPNNGGGTANNPRYPGGINNYPIPGSSGGSAGNPNAGGGSANSPNYPGGINNYPIPGSSGGPASNPNNGGGTANNPNYPGGINNYPIPSSGSPGNPNNGGGTANNPSYPGGINNYPIPGGGSPNNPSGGGGTANNPNYPGGINNYPIPGSSGGSASNPSSGPGSAGNPNPGGGTANNPRLTGNASSNANGAGNSPSGPGAGQRPLDFIPNALNGFVNQFQNGGQNLQNASNAMRGVAQTFEDQWTKPNGGINQVAAMAAFHGIGGALKFLAPAIKGAAADAAANAPAIVAKAAAATTGIVARAKNFAAKLFGRGPPTEPVNPTENPTSLTGSASKAGENATGATNAGEPGAGNPGENPASPAEPAPGELGSPQNPLTGAAVSQQWNNLAGQTVKIGDKTFNLGASRGAGTFGGVYENKNTPGTLLKVIRPDEKGIESLRGQVSGDQVLKNAGTGIVTPTIDPVSSGGTNALIMQDVKSMFPGAQTFKPTDSVSALNPQQRAAIQNLYNELKKRGIVWADGQLSNVFLYDTPNGLQAGILDTDRIFPVEAFKAQPSYVSGPLFIELGGKITDAKYIMDMLFAKYYG